MDDLKSEGFREVYCYAGPDAGVDYSRYDLLNDREGELLVFEWDNWSEGEIKGSPARLERLRGRYELSEPVED